ncbi:MAG: flagellin, partial [Frankiales bacterium]|nr:flagellin [Frankiales bacterium]
MSLRVNTNIAAMNAYRNLTVTEGNLGKSLEKLSSGFRINRAADDAAGL